MELIRIENLNITQNENILFKNFNLTLNEKEIIGIYAPTGKGKTTLLNYIADTNKKESNLKINGTIIKSDDIKISYVFQEPRLISDCNVLKNVTLALENIYTKNESKDKATEILKSVDLEGKINNNVTKLSGGEKQRVSIARAFVYPSNVLLMDEPFQSQDKEKTKKLLALTKEIVELQNRSCIIVSHNIDELKYLTDNILTEKDFISE